MTNSLFPSFIMAGEIRQYVEDISQYIEQIDSYTEPIVLGIQAPPNHGKTTLIEHITSFAQGKGWLVARFPLKGIDKPDITLVEIVEELLRAGSEHNSTTLKDESEQFHRFKSRPVGLLKEEDYDRAVSRVLIGYKAYDPPRITVTDLRTDIEKTMRLAVSEGVPGILYIFLDGQTLLDDKLVQLRETLESTLQTLRGDRIIFLIAGQSLPFDETIYTQVFNLHPMTSDVIWEFIQEVIPPDRAFSRTLAEDIFVLTNGIPADVTKIVRALFDFAAQNPRETISLSSNVLRRVVKQTTGALITNLNAGEIDTLIHLLSFEGWRISEVVRYRLLEAFANDPSLDWELEKQAQIDYLERVTSELADAGLLHPNPLGSHIAFSGGALERFLLTQLAKEKKIDVPVVKGPFVDSIIDLLRTILRNNHDLREAASVPSQTGTSLVTFVKTWTGQLAQGMLNLEHRLQQFVVEQTGYTRSFVQRLQYPEFLSYLIPSTSVEERSFLGLEVHVGMGGRDVKSYFLIMMPNPTLNEQETTQLANTIQTELEPLSTLIDLRIRNIEQITEDIPPLHEIAAKAHHRLKHTLVKEIINAFIMRVASNFGHSEPQEALDILEPALDIPSSPQTAFHKGLIYNVYAFKLAAKQEYDEALDYWERALDHYPEDSQRMSFTMEDIGYVRAVKKEWQDALEACEEALRLDDKRNTRVNYLFVKFCTDAPAPKWNWELASKPEVASATLCTMAPIYKALGDDNEAFRCLQRAVDLSPTALYVHRALGWYYLSKGQKADAKRAFEKAQELDANNEYEFFNYEIGKCS